MPALTAEQKKQLRILFNEPLLGKAIKVLVGKNKADALKTAFIFCCQKNPAFKARFFRTMGIDNISQLTGLHFNAENRTVSIDIERAGATAHYECERGPALTAEQEKQLRTLLNTPFLVDSVNYLIDKKSNNALKAAFLSCCQKIPDFQHRFFEIMQIDDVSQLINLRFNDPENRTVSIDIKRAGAEAHYECKRYKALEMMEHNMLRGLSSNNIGVAAAKIAHLNRIQEKFLNRVTPAAIRAEPIAEDIKLKDGTYLHKQIFNVGHYQLGYEYKRNAVGDIELTPIIPEGTPKALQLAIIDFQRMDHHFFNQSLVAESVRNQNFIKVNPAKTAFTPTPERSDTPTPEKPEQTRRSRPS